MSNISFKTDLLKETLKSYTKELPIKLDEKKVTAVPLVKENKDLLGFLHVTMKLTPSQKTKINGFLNSTEGLADVKVGSINELYNRIMFLNTAVEPALEIKINDKYYPLLCSVHKFRTFTGSFMMELTAYASLGALQYSKREILGDWSFHDNEGNPSKKTIAEILDTCDLRVASKEALEHSMKLNNKLHELNNHVNEVYDAHGIGLLYHNYFGWQETNIGWKDSPSTVVIEPNLEDQYGNRSARSETWHLPFLRVFSMKHKNYFYVDVENVGEHTFHPEDKEKIVLPKNMFAALDSMFNAKQDHIFGDVFHGRHGGIVVLANGPSGVGKTLTAEVFAEFQKRPLYSMEMSEIGTSLKEVEANLQRIFARAKKWNAVLLFDEADIFLSERVASDLERSAIVGIFLRLLDYYEGTFFLTTNRGEGIDKAFKSRVTLYLNYPELSPETRKIIWDNMLKSASLEVTEDSSWKDIAEASLNGRQIRNQVRLLKLMYPDNKLKTSEIMASLDFAAR